MLHGVQENVGVAAGGRYSHGGFEVLGEFL
jgi:hypothetical protein